MMSRMVRAREANTVTMHVRNNCVRRPKSIMATLRLILQAESYFVSSKCLDPGSGREIPAILHGAGAYPSVFLVYQKPSTHSAINPAINPAKNS